MELLVEAGHRQPVHQRERLDCTPAVFTTTAVIDEVEVDLEGLCRRGACMRRVVSPRTSTYRGTCHQWLRGGTVAIRILPTICTHRCSVSLVGSQLVERELG